MNSDDDPDSLVMDTTNRSDHIEIIREIMKSVNEIGEKTASEQYNIEPIVVKKQLGANL